MTTKNYEIKTYFGRCRCCLNYGYLKSMWMEHFWEGTTEIYGTMLTECFDISWAHPMLLEQDQICDMCILRLRDAFQFKKQILMSQNDFLENVTEMDYQIKEENVYEEVLEAEHDIDNEEENIKDVEQDVKKEKDYEEIEYLDEEYLVDNKQSLEIENEQITDDVAYKSAPSDTEQPIPQRKRKWPRKLPKQDRRKTYRQYTEEDFRLCLEAIKSNKMTRSEAAKQYNVPAKTLAAKLRAGREEPETKETDLDREKTYNFLREIKTILTYVNATPFKSRANRFYCAYCSDETHFYTAEELRTHTRTNHTDKATKVEFMMRPFWMNEILRLDIDNLLCNVCCISLGSWNVMFDHLRDTHEVELDQAYTKVVPYLLDDAKCALCKEKFSHYMQVDGHMNAHYSNHICKECGDTFLTSSRLKTHLKRHNIGKYPCDQCDKVFSLEIYKRKHINSVHDQKLQFKCMFCEEKFAMEYARHAHCVQKHKEKLKVITCELCGKTFTWSQHYSKHMRLSHAKEKKYGCDVCGKRFVTNYELKEHELRHTGEKNFPCEVCNKKYFSRTARRLHMQRHRILKKSSE